MDSDPLTDDLVSAFSSSLNASTTQLSQFQSVYKTRIRDESNQEQRRRLLLKQQKEKRQLLINENRNLDSKPDLKRKFNEIWKREERFIENASSDREQWHRQAHSYKNALMHSEWLTEVPDDFTNWIMVPCPVGKRHLIVTRQTYATSYSKYGTPTSSFPTLLPRGTILDSIWCDQTQSFYILDVIQWNHMNIINCQTDFRFFWLSNQLKENPRLSEYCKSNAYPIRSLNQYKCDKNTLRDAMSEFPLFNNNKPKLDGLLFYHSETHYTPGTTPLVGWLKAFMIPEILEIYISVKYLEEKPLEYKTMQIFIEEFNKNQKSRKNKKWKKSKTDKMACKGPKEKYVVKEERIEGKNVIVNSVPMLEESFNEKLTEELKAKEANFEESKVELIGENSMEEENKEENTEVDDSVNKNLEITRN